MRNGNQDPYDPSDVDDEDPQYAVRKRINSKRPETWHLQPGTVTVTGSVYPLFNVGDRIIVERMSSILNDHPWLDTRLYKVVDIDDETKLVTCLDLDADHHGVVSYDSKYQKVFLTSGDESPEPQVVLRKKRRGK